MVPVEVLKVWWDDPNHLMLVEDDNVGLATYEYPGVYTLHWYYQSARGRKAIDLGKKMVRYLFEHCGAKTVRGLVRTDRKEMKAANWACRQVGMKAHGKMTFANGIENELFVLTKDEFLEGTN
jgi:hypothetical protein